MTEIENIIKERDFCEMEMKNKTIDINTLKNELIDTKILLQNYQITIIEEINESKNKRKELLDVKNAH